MHLQVALWSLLLAPWLLWFGACGLGLMHHEWGHVGAPKEPHLMHEFDRCAYTHRIMQCMRHAYTASLLEGVSFA